jgi:EAL domain-containing protein (putative c-di-GMP-specific phosphodiesterase class I)
MAEGDAVIVRSIVDLAHSLGMPMIDERMESAARLSFLRDRGCDIVQNHLTARPKTGIAGFCQSPPHMPE